MQSIDDVNDWIAVVNEKQWYIGEVIEFYEEEVHLDFLGKFYMDYTEGIIYTWPVKKDAIWVARKKQVRCNLLRYL